jgi:hypothetical protein
MFLKNTAVCLIEICAKNEAGEVVKFPIAPLQTVEVPDVYCKSDFVKTLIKNDELIKVAAPDDEEEADDEDIRAELERQADELDIGYNSRTSNETLEERIKEALAE